MSWKALAWAAKCQVKHSADKLVLLGLAERHNEESGTAYPSVDWLSEFGSLNRKTVITSLGRLEELGLISDSGDRKGRTLQVKAYSLNLETVPISVQSQKRNSSDFSGKQSQKRDTEPSKEPIPKKDKPSLDKRAKKQTPAHRLPSDWQPEPLTPGTVAYEIVAAWQPGRLERELSKFRDHWAAASGEKARKHDWQAAWRTWIGNADEYGSRHGRQPDTLRGTRPDPALDMLRQAQAELAAGRYQDPDRSAWPSLPSLGSG